MSSQAPDKAPDTKNDNPRPDHEDAAASHGGKPWRYLLIPP
jgi:hypothetical protein